MNKKLICFLLGIAGLWGLGIANEVLGKEKAFPTKPIELICPWGAGGSTYLGGRTVAETLSNVLGNPAVVISKTGGGGAVATLYVAKSKPDGHTLLIATTANNVTIPALRSVGYTNADFELLASYGKYSSLLAIKSDAPWRTLEELVTEAKKEPGKLKYSSSGHGTSSQFTMELFKIAAGGLRIDHVPFKSGPEALTALLGGHVHMSSFNPVDVKGTFEAGKVRILATWAEKRLEDYPNIPTFTELGYPEVKFVVFHGVAAPKGVPKEVTDILKEGLYKTIQDPDVKKRLKDLGFIPFFQNAEEFAKFVSEEDRKIRMIIKEADIKMD